MNATMSMASEGVTMDAVENGRFDTLNNVYYSEATVFGMTVYSYYDINNHLIYSSSDKLEWEKETDNEISLPVFPGTVIGKCSNIYPLSSVRKFVPAYSIYKNQGEVVTKHE